jgi:RNA polymerase sigma-70 factor (ECF subfamily)
MAEPQSADADDGDLILALHTDPIAFEAFYRRHVGKVMGFAVRRLHDPEQVADLVAATFVAVIESSPRYDRRRGSPVAWLLGIAYHHLLRQRQRSLGEARAWARMGGRRQLEPDDHAELERRIDAARLTGSLHTALAALPAGERAVLELVSLDELTPSQAAAVLGINPAAARMRLARARRRVRHALTPGGVTDLDRPELRPAVDLQPALTTWRTR